MFTLKPLPYAQDALVPFFSEETLQYHHKRHQNGYVTNLNRLLQTSKQFQTDRALTLKRVILEGEEPLRLQAEQIWNHEFFWTCLRPTGTAEHAELILPFVQKQFSTFDGFKTAIKEKAQAHFGSGWLWLSVQTDQTCVLESKMNSENPMREGKRPILTIDLWEHAYYIDFRNDRAAYLESILCCLDWEKLAKRWKEALSK